MKISVQSVPLPPGTLIEGALPKIDYTDTYTAIFISLHDLAPVDVARAFFRSFPRWLILLLRLRDAAARLFGLKTADGAQYADEIDAFTGTKGEGIVFFRVFDVNSGELLMGADDRHLDFRISFFLKRSGEFYSMSAATIVKFNGWSGRAYFVPVRPIHRIIMPVILRRMIRYHLASRCEL